MSRGLDRYAAGPIHPDPTYAGEAAPTAELVYDNGELLSGSAAPRPDQVGRAYFPLSVPPEITLCTRRLAC